MRVVTSNLFYLITVTLWIMNLMVADNHLVHVITLCSIVLLFSVNVWLCSTGRRNEANGVYASISFSVAFVLHVMFFALISLARSKGTLFDSTIHSINVSLALVSSLLARKIALGESGHRAPIPRDPRSRG